MPATTSAHERGRAKGHRNDEEHQSQRDDMNLLRERTVPQSLKSRRLCVVHICTHVSQALSSSGATGQRHCDLFKQKCEE